jgi:ubiquinone/menaquinone biosynthesis C-methylase UbiE
MEKRPFYASFAWAYDWILAEPGGSRFDQVVELFSQHGVLPGSRLLDAGCGTGRYAIELAKRGYRITGLDASPELLLEARKKAEALTLPLTFVEGNLLQLQASPVYDGLLCRGVLNDLTDETSRRGAFHAFARALRPGGLLLLDVREWQMTVKRKEQEPLTEARVQTDRGLLTYRSLTRLEHATRCLLISERHQLERGEEVRIAEYEFVMRCWLPAELQAYLEQAGFVETHSFGDYATHAPLGTTDRMVVAARKKMAFPSTDVNS